MDEARQAIRTYRPETLGHLDTNLISSNFSLSSKIRMSDYPVLYWLLEISRNRTIDLFDFGGGVGQTFVGYSKYLPADVLIRWTVQDLAEVVTGVPEKFFSGTAPTGLCFTDSMKVDPACNVILAAGAFHYWEQSLAEFFEVLTAKPAYFIINRSPMRTHGEEFHTVQQGQNWAVACKVRSVEGVVAEMDAEGYSLLDSWIDLEKSLTLPFFPAFSCPYRGLCFKRKDQH